MARSQYYSEEDNATGGGGGGMVGGGSGGGMGSGSAPAPSGNGGSGFVNLQSYLDANQSGAAQVADTLAGDVGSQVDASNQELTNMNQWEMGNALGVDTRGNTVGTSEDLSAGAESAALSGLQDYGMSADTQADYLGVASDQAGIKDYGSNLVNKQGNRKEAVQRLYGEGRGSGFGGLDAFLGGASGGLEGGVSEATGQLGDVAAGQASVQGAYDTANETRRANTSANYESARGAKEIQDRQAKEAAIQKAKDERATQVQASNNTPGYTDPFGGGGSFGGWQQSASYTPPPPSNPNITSSFGTPTAEANEWEVVLAGDGSIDSSGEKDMFGNPIKR